MKSNAQNIYEDWIQFIDVQKAKRTAHEYGCIIQKYFKDCKITNLEKVTPRMVADYVNGPNENTGRCRRRQILMVIKMFHDYAFKLALCKKDPD